jgi:phytoene dehydrogenase-like protein
VRPADASSTGAGGSAGRRRTIAAPLVVCDVDYRLALGLLPSEVAVAEREAASRRHLTSSDFTLFLGVERDRVDLSAFRADQLLVKIDEGESAPRAGWERSSAEFRRDELWFAWWSRRDPRLAPPGCEALVLKTAAPYAAFAPFDGGGRGRHAAAYYVAKERLADALLEAGEAVVPGLRAAVRVREVATPLTFRHWGHRSEGSVAGWSWRAGDIAGFRAQDLVATTVPGLRMVGLQAYTRLFWGGVGSSLQSGLRAAQDQAGNATLGRRGDAAPV